MGRRSRLVLPGGIYDVHERTFCGAHVSHKSGEADLLEGFIPAKKERDEFQVLPWCVMANHDDLAVWLGRSSFDGVTVVEST